MARKLHIQPQPSLPPSRQLAIAANGVQHRILRSSLTLAVVVLAVAFLTNVLVEHDISQSCKAGVGALSQQQRELGEFAAFVDTPLTPNDFAVRLAALPADGWQLQALAHWLDDDPSTLRADAVALTRYRAWFDALRIGNRRQLVGKLGREAAFEHLRAPGARDELAATARAIPLRLPDGLLAFLARHEAVMARLQTAATALSGAREQWRGAVQGRTFIEWLTSDTAPAALLAEHQLQIEATDLQRLQGRAREQAQGGYLMQTLGRQSLTAAYAKQHNQVLERQVVLRRLAHDSDLAAWLIGQLGDDPVLTDAGVVQTIATRLVDDRGVLNVEARLTGAYGTRMGLSANTFWLLVVSLLVCAAGITNAMLVSVLERFREIATMKCLGALDGFIARLFLTESAFLGGTGGVLGVILGCLIGVARMVSGYGNWVTRFFPWAEILETAAICIGCGLGLAMVSALYPAYSAARMPPMAAMRVD